MNQTERTNPTKRAARKPKATTARDGESTDIAPTLKARAGALIEQQMSHHVAAPVEGLATLGRVLRFAADQLEGWSGAPWIDAAATRVEHSAIALRDARVSDVVTSIEGFARRSPMAFVGAAALVGVVGGRFLKNAS